MVGLGSGSTGRGSSSEGGGGETVRKEWSEKHSTTPFRAGLTWAIAPLANAILPEKKKMLDEFKFLVNFFLLNGNDTGLESEVKHILREIG